MDDVDEILEKVSHWSNGEKFDPLELEAVANARVLHGETVLHFASIEGFEKEVAFLASTGLMCDVRNRLGSTPLTDCVKLENFSMIRCLVESGADVNFPDENGNTPLHFAMRPDQLNVEITVYLKSAGASESVANIHGELPGQFEF